MRKLRDIVFPVYRIPNYKTVRVVDGLVKLDDQILDDTNVKEETLALRRLRSPLYQELYKMRISHPTLEAFLRRVKRGQKFIDSSGHIFTYIPSRFFPVKTLYIDRVDRNYSYVRVFLKGIRQPLIDVTGPRNAEPWAVVVFRAGSPWFILSYSHYKNKDTKKKL